MKLWKITRYIKEEFEKTRPTEPEVYNMLKFFLIFSMGCKKMQLKKLADDFEHRANLFIIGMNQLGFKNNVVGPTGMMNQIVRSIGNQINPDRYI